MNVGKKIIPILLGPSVFLLMQLIGAPSSMPPLAFQVLAVTFWVAIWWVTEAIPMAVTAMLPILLFPLTGALDIKETTTAFGDKYIFLYLGGFLIAIAIEKWDLHKRIALTIIDLIGSNFVRIILGFMVATAFLSMWISNTATSVMMLPIAIAVAEQFKKSHDGKKNGKLDAIGKALMLAVAYSASIGGFSTLIGTPPNLVLAGVLEETYGVKISFFDWMKFGLPISITLIFICWKYLTLKAFPLKNVEFPGGRKAIRKMKKDLGKISKQERVVLWVFIATATLWVTRSLLQKLIPNLDDTIIAMAAGTLLFILPSGKGKTLLVWKDAKRLPWDIILLFGGGLALARGFNETGLAVWIASQLTDLQGLSLIFLILVMVASVNFLTEITSNLATTAMLLPVLAPMALAFDLHPYMIMVSVTISASCAFMLPVATPPNAVVFGSGYLRIPDMVRTGFFMNLVSILIISLLTFYMLPIIWDFDQDAFPAAFMQK
ncbi:SLC13 family permease [Fulvivirga lutea]|uniref:SLC13/DASS family transporter n=1 Tax=Fulvivirga lutea TaxID=2810512 RepID=A0A974WIG8_9BACT|nr:SLC13 family permease [Fulvivirga lutea]QSE98760.1 SLC13/DASS family transporter [Fulvivirga lutea]